MVPFERGGRGGHVNEGVCVRGVPVLLLILAGVASEADASVEQEFVVLQHKTKRGSIREVRKLKWGRLEPQARGGDA